MSIKYVSVFRPSGCSHTVGRPKCQRSFPSHDRTEAYGRRCHYPGSHLDLPNFIIEHVQQKQDAETELVPLRQPPDILQNHI